MTETSHAPATTLSWATGLLSRRTVELNGAEIVVTDRNLGRVSVQKIPAERLDPTPIPHQKHNRLLMMLVVFGLGISVSSLIDWSARTVVTEARALGLAAAWSALTFALTLHYLRTCGAILTWSWKISRRPALEIPARLGARIDIAAFLRVPTLAASTETAVVGTATDRLQQLDELLKKGHISDEEYRVLKRKALEEHRRAPIPKF